MVSNTPNNESSIEASNTLKASSTADPGFNLHALQLKLDQIHIPTKTDQAALQQIPILNHIDKWFEWQNQFQQVLNLSGLDDVINGSFDHNEKIDSKDPEQAMTFARRSQKWSRSLVLVEQALTARISLCA